MPQIPQIVALDIHKYTFWGTVRPGRMLFLLNVSAEQSVYEYSVGKRNRIEVSCM